MAASESVPLALGAGEAVGEEELLACCVLLTAAVAVKECRGVRDKEALSEGEGEGLPGSDGVKEAVTESMDTLALGEAVPVPVRPSVLDTDALAVVLRDWDTV